MKYKSCAKCAKSVGTVNIIGNILMILIKGYLGVVGRSKGLIADAIHSSADLLATIIMVIGMRISEKEKNDEYPYGFGKAEYIVSIVIYLFLFFVGSFVCVGLVRRRWERSETRQVVMMPRMTARTPVIKKLGRIVMAGSQACHTASASQGGPMDVIIMPSGFTFPCWISK